MNFHKVLEEPITENFQNIKYREAVRAIIMSGNHILLVQSNRGDYKFPGGGVEKDESQTDALIREVREETGYINCMVKEKAGTVIERRMDEFNIDALFEMTSHYYFCELTNEEKTSQQLDEYESVLDFTPKWVPLEDAIMQNVKLIKEIEKNSWLQREAFVLKEIQNQFVTGDKVSRIRG